MILLHSSNFWERPCSLAIQFWIGWITRILSHSACSDYSSTSSKSCPCIDFCCITYCFCWNCWKQPYDTVTHLQRYNAFLRSWNSWVVLISAAIWFAVTVTFAMLYHSFWAYLNQLLILTYHFPTVSLALSIPLSILSWIPCTVTTLFPGVWMLAIWAASLVD